MSKPGRSKQNRIGEDFTPILKHMVRSPAFHRLTNAARVAYLLLKNEVNKPKQTNVIFPYESAKTYMDKRTFTRSIKQLCELGFIEKSDFGGLYRRTNVYRFIENWRSIE
jgi:hypothetical protein